MGFQVEWGERSHQGDIGFVSSEIEDRDSLPLCFYKNVSSTNTMPGINVSSPLSIRLSANFLFCERSSAESLPTAKGGLSFISHEIG